MSEVTQAGIVILLTVLGVLLLNATILIMVRGRKSGSEIEVMRRLGSAARKPFAKSDAQFDELSRLVKELSMLLLILFFSINPVTPFLKS